MIGEDLCWLNLMGGSICMLLDCDEQLFMTYKQSGEKGAEKLLSKWVEAEIDSPADPKILGTALSPSLFLVNEEAAMNIAFSTARKYWGRVTADMTTFINNHGLDTKFVNERLNAFFLYAKRQGDLF